MVIFQSYVKLPEGIDPRNLWNPGTLGIDPKNSRNYPAVKVSSQHVWNTILVFKGGKTRIIGISGGSMKTSSITRESHFFPHSITIESPFK